MPLTAATRGLIGARELALLPPGAFVINVSRGAIFDQAALIEALRSGRLSGAALDVFDPEPLPADSPLWDLPNVVLTPHSSGRTTTSATSPPTCSSPTWNASWRGARCSTWPTGPWATDVAAEMDHWYLTAPRTIGVLREPVPEPGPGQARVRIAHTAISPGSNVHVYRTGSYAGDGSNVNEELLYMGSGVVDAVGAGVDGLVPGEPVVLSTGHQAYTVAPVESLQRVPAGLSLREAGISYLCAWSVSALHLGSYRAAETVVVVGQGLVGSSAALVADLMGARVLALDVDERRVALARRLGLGSVEQPGAPGADERMTAFLGANGVDLILETTGSWHGLRQAIQLARDFTASR